MKGIDVSEHNGIIDWNVLKNEIDFAIIRLGWIGNNSNKLDKYFERNISECRRLKIPVGVYVFNYVKTPQRAKECASWVLEQLSDIDLQLPVYIDMENDDSSSFKLSSLGRNMLTLIVQAFNTEIEKGGYWAGLYANRNWYDNYLHKDELIKRYTSWIAHYGVSEDRYKNEYDMLQFTESGKIEGIKGLDIDVMYRDLIKEINNVPRPTKSNEELADEVIQGLWGNADSVPSRKERLENAGYDYQAIQDIVNQKLSNNSYFPACSKNYNSIVDALKSIGVDSSFENRKRIAEVNRIKDYRGSSEQNNKMLALLKDGRLKNF